MEVHVLNRQRTHPVSTRSIASFVRRVADEVPAATEASLSVCMVSDRRMRELNRQFRDRDRTTDVLSFVDDGEPDEEGERYLGDIVISVPTAAEQARSLGHSLSRELKRLVLHGYLHLLGYDHETDNGKMRRLERRLATRLLA